MWCLCGKGVEEEGRGGRGRHGGLLLDNLNSFLVASDSRRAGNNSKSLRRKQKDAAWRSRQKGREVQRVEEPPKPKLPCKYYLNGHCKHVSPEVKQEFPMIAF